MNDSKLSCVRCRVYGRVQGVWFRGSTQEKAQSLGLTGHAINLEDGSVEVLACGTARAIDELKIWLARGPELARVDRMECAVESAHLLHQFETG